MNNKAIILGATTLVGLGAYGINQQVSACGLGVAEFEVIASSLNVRPETNTSKNPIGKLTRGQKVVPYEKSGSWGKIKLANGKEGWVSMDYLKSIDKHDIPSNNDSTSSKKWTGVVSNLGGKTLNVRYDASTNSSVKGSLKEGDIVKVQHQVNRRGRVWFRIRYNGSNYGYVAKEYVKAKTNDVEKPSNNNDLTGEVYDEETGNIRWFERTVYAPAGDPLNVRVKPTTKSDAITKVVRYSKIFVAGESKNNPGWYKVSGVDDKGKSFEGWAYSKYIF